MQCIIVENVPGNTLNQASHSYLVGSSELIGNRLTGQENQGIGILVQGQQKAVICPNQVGKAPLVSDCALFHPRINDITLCPRGHPIQTLRITEKRQVALTTSIVGDIPVG